MAVETEQDLSKAEVAQTMRASIRAGLQKALEVAQAAVTEVQQKEALAKGETPNLSKGLEFGCSNKSCQSLAGPKPTGKTKGSKTEYKCSKCGTTTMADLPHYNPSHPNYAATEAKRHKLDSEDTEKSEGSEAKCPKRGCGTMNKSVDAGVLNKSETHSRYSCSNCGKNYSAKLEKSFPVSPSGAHNDSSHPIDSEPAKEPSKTERMIDQHMDHCSHCTHKDPSTCPKLAGLVGTSSKIKKSELAKTLPGMNISRAMRLTAAAKKPAAPAAPAPTPTPAPAAAPLAKTSAGMNISRAVRLDAAAKKVKPITPAPTPTTPAPISKAEGESKKSSWDHLLPEHRSEHRGWSKAGEFHCPHCSTQIGKNLKDQRPFSQVEHHMKTEHPGLKKNENCGDMEMSEEKTVPANCKSCGSSKPHSVKWEGNGSVLTCKGCGKVTGGSPNKPIKSDLKKATSPEGLKLAGNAIPPPTPMKAKLPGTTPKLPGMTPPSGAARPGGYKLPGMRSKPAVPVHTSARHANTEIGAMQSVAKNPLV